MHYCYRLENTKITKAGKECLKKASHLSRSSVEITYTPNIHLQRRLESKTKDQSLNCDSSYSQWEYMDLKEF